MATESGPHRSGRSRSGGLHGSETGPVGLGGGEDGPGRRARSPPPGAGPGRHGRPRRTRRRPSRDRRHRPLREGVRTRLYRDGSLVKENFPVDEISDHLEDDTACVIWLDLCGPPRAARRSSGPSSGSTRWPSRTRWARSSGPRSTATRPTCSCRPTRHPRRGTGALVSHEISVFIPPKALITVRKDPAFDIEPVVDAGTIPRTWPLRGVFLLYGLLDYLVDGHFRAVESLDEPSRRPRTSCSTPTAAAIE